jgi:hypothetical protein
MTDLQVGAVRGFRLFRLGPDRSLGSYSATYQWTAGQNEAACNGKKHRDKVPAIGCGCGFWMYSDLQRCALMFRAELLGINAYARGHVFGGFEPRAEAIIGQTRGWGRVLEGEAGWRTQFAALDALVDIGHPVDLGPVADRYNVPVVLMPTELSLVRTGILTRRDERATEQGKVGIWLKDRRFWVSMNSPAFFDLWKLKLGTAVELHLDVQTGEVVRAIPRADLDAGTATDALGVDRRTRGRRAPRTSEVRAQGDER